MFCSTWLASRCAIGGVGCGLSVLGQYTASTTYHPSLATCLQFRAWGILALLETTSYAATVKVDFVPRCSPVIAVWWGVEIVVAGLVIELCFGFHLQAYIARELVLGKSISLLHVLVVLDLGNLTFFENICVDEEVEVAACLLQLEDGVVVKEGNDIQLKLSWYLCKIRVSRQRYHLSFLDMTEDSRLVEPLWSTSLPGFASVELFDPFFQGWLHGENIAKMLNLNSLSCL